MNILLVDDRPENLVALEALLGELGQNLVKASSGEEALKYLLQDDFALVLLDVQMPGMDGFETAQLIRQRDRTRHVPILFITAFHTDRDSAARGYSFGAADYLCKPVDPAALKSKVSAFVGLAQMTQELQAEVLLRQQAELRAQRLAAEMERRVEERTAQLEAAGQRKDELLRMLAHELRNPLGALANAMEVMERSDRDSSNYHRAHEVARRQLERQTRLVDRLLEVAELADGTLELRRETLDLAELARHAAADCEPELVAAQLKLRLELPEEPVWVDADPICLAQAAAELLENAARFSTPGGEVSLTVRVEPDEERAAVIVRDTGVGISVEILPHVFEPLVQADRSLDRRRGGTGLGLARVKGWIELHGGEARVASEGPGRGAEFTLVLPLAREAAAPPTAEAPPPAALRPLRILLVEDNADGAATLRDLLQMMGHTVEVADSATAGLEAARQLQPHVALLDIGLPETDGYSLARRFRRDNHLAGTKLVALTGYSDPRARSRSRQAGFDHHLVKPLDLAELHRLLASLPEA